MPGEYFEDPVAAYDRLAPFYAELSRKREPYLRGVEREIISRISPGSQALLDVGAGEGSRAARIASQTGIARVVLAEPSAKMSGIAEKAEVWPVRAEQLGSRGGADDGQFDVITCLWNVLGHVPTGEKRLHAFSAITRLLAPKGKVFLDVNHRYNLPSYGLILTSARWIRDLLFPSENNGDVCAKWEEGGTSVSTYGHVFTHGEIVRVAAMAGLSMEARVVIDYDSGRVRRFGCQGNLLYIFRPSSRIDSASAPQTS